MWLVIFNIVSLPIAWMAFSSLKEANGYGALFANGFALFGMLAWLIGGNWLIERGNRKSEAVAAAEAEYNKIHNLAWAEYKKARDASKGKGKDEFYKVRDAAYAKYKKVNDPAWDEYMKAVAAETWDSKGK